MSAVKWLNRIILMGATYVGGQATVWGVKDLMAHKQLNDAAQVAPDEDTANIIAVQKVIVSDNEMIDVKQLAAAALAALMAAGASAMEEAGNPKMLKKKGRGK